MENQNEKQVAPITILNQYIKDLSLEIPHAPQIFTKIDTQPQIKIDAQIHSEVVDKNIYNISLSFRIDGDVKDEKFFIVELDYCGVVSLNIPDEHVDAVLKIEVPHMLFPYARQAISGVLMDAGLPPLMLNPIDFVAMYHANKKSETN